jgi:hypothetical protein
VVLRSSDRITRVPPYLIRPIELPVRGCHPVSLAFPDHSSHSHGSAGPRSLAATDGVSIDFLSSGYLDVSVPRVCLLNPMYSGSRYLDRPTVDCRKAINSRASGGLPHSDIHGSKPIPGSPWLNAGYHVLHRLLLPRHPPNALFALDSTRKEQGRVPFAKRSLLPVESFVHSQAISVDTAVSCTRLGTVSCLPRSEDPGAIHPPLGAIGTKPMCFSLNDVKR